MLARINIIGLRFGKLKVRCDGPTKICPSGSTFRTSICDCDCGKTVVVLNFSLRGGYTKSCGCMQRVTHGYTRGHRWPRIYQIWNKMKGRCNNPNNKSFKNYGGRGITVCPEWNDFAQFVNDMGEGKAGWTLERINNEEGYRLYNCCWATRTHQARNRRTNVKYTVQGITGCIAELSEHFGLNVKTVSNRLYNLQWDIERALLTPIRRSHRSL